MEILPMLSEVKDFHLGGLPDFERCPFLGIVATLPTRLGSLHLGSRDYHSREWHLIASIFELHPHLWKLILVVWSHRRTS